MPAPLGILPCWCRDRSFTPTRHLLLLCSLAELLVSPWETPLVSAIHVTHLSAGMLGGVSPLSYESGRSSWAGKVSLDCACCSNKQIPLV